MVGGPIWWLAVVVLVSECVVARVPLGGEVISVPFLNPDFFFQLWLYMVVHALVVLNRAAMHHLLRWVRVPPGTWDEHHHRNLQ